MKTIKIIFSLLILLIAFSCSDDDIDPMQPEVVVPEEGEENQEATAVLENIITELTNNDSKVWRIESAELPNTTLDIANLYNVRDDEFTFSVNPTTSQVQLDWKRGFQVIPADNMEDAKSDLNISSENFEIEILISDNIINVSDVHGNRFFGNYNSSTQSIFGLLYYQEGEEPLSAVLIEKSADDYVTAASSLSNPTELFEFETGIFRVGFKISQADNSLFITNRNDLEINGQQAFKLDLSTNSNTGFSFTQQDFATKNIEFIGNQIVSLGGSKFEVFDYDFANVAITADLGDNAIISNGSASLDNEVYLFGGIVNGGSNQLSTWALGDINYTDQAVLPFELNDIDGEIIDQKLYMFGGWESSSNTSPGSNKVYIYDLDFDSFSEVTIPVNLYETYTSVVEHLIYVGGLKSEDIDNDGDFERVPYFGVFNTLTANFQQIELNVGNLLDNRRLVHLQVAGDKAYFISSESLGAPDGFINRVYSADLD